MSSLDDIICDHRAFVADVLQERMPKGKPILTEELVTIDSKAKQQIKDLILELADQVELETDITTGIPDAIALLCQKVNAL